MPAVAATDQIARGALAEFLKGRGFRRSSRTFRRITDLDDVAIVDVMRTLERPEGTAFAVYVSVVPAPVRAWFRDGLGARVGAPTHGEALWLRPVPPPARAGGPELPEFTWWYERGSDPDDAGRAVARELDRPEYLPKALWYLDRATLITELRKPHEPWDGFVGGKPSHLIQMLIPDGLTPELEELLAAREASQRPDEFDAWARKAAAEASRRARSG